MLSILVCTYNHARFLEHCLNSALGKGEIIVVNDASTDNTLEVLSKFSNKIKVITNKERKNLLESRKIAFENCTGDNIVFLDDDDELINPVITDADITQGKAISNYPLITNWFENGVERKDKNKRVDYHMWGKVLKRELVEKVYEQLPMSFTFMQEDRLFMSKAFELANSYKFVEEVFYNYNYWSGYSHHRNLLEGK